MGEIFLVLWLRSSWKVPCVHARFSIEGCQFTEKSWARCGLHSYSANRRVSSWTQFASSKGQFLLEGRDLKKILLAIHLSTIIHPFNTRITYRIRIRWQYLVLRVAEVFALRFSTWWGWAETSTGVQKQLFAARYGSSLYFYAHKCSLIVFNSCASHSLSLLSCSPTCNI